MKKEIITDINLDKLNGEKGLVLFFYPKAMTSGCSLEVAAYNNKLNDFKALGYNVVGVSMDDEKSNFDFSCEYDLNFPLISDVNKTLINRFNVLGEKMNYGKKYIGIIRSTFVINKNDNIIIEMRNVQPVEHIDELLTKLKEL